MVKTGFALTVSLREFQNALKVLDAEAVAVERAGLGLEARKLMNACINPVPVENNPNGHRLEKQQKSPPAKLAPLDAVSETNPSLTLSLKSRLSTRGKEKKSTTD